MKALSFGEVLWDVYSDSKHLGGAPFNFAAHFKKCGGQSWIITSVGDDDLGEEAVFETKRIGINTDYIAVTKHETGKCLVSLDSNKIPSYNLLNNVAYDYIQKYAFEKDFFDVLYFGTLALRNEANRDVLKQVICENHFSDIFVDVNIRPPYYSDEVAQFACKNATIIKISEEELPMLMYSLDEKTLSVNECAQILSERFDNLKVIIITRGEKGSVVFETQRRRFYECAAQKVAVASTVGAGDSFSAAFITRYNKTKDIQTSLSFATKVSGYVVSCMEAVPEYDPEEFERQCKKE